MRQRRVGLLAAVLLILAALACNFPVPATPNPLEAAATIVALTLQAQGLPTSAGGPAATATPSPSATPAPPILYIREEARCRSGPGPNFKVVATFAPGLALEMVGQDIPDDTGWSESRTAPRPAGCRRRTALRAGISSTCRRSRRRPARNVCPPGQALCSTTSSATPTRSPQLCGGPTQPTTRMVTASIVRAAPLLTCLPIPPPTQIPSATFSARRSRMRSRLTTMRAPRPSARLLLPVLRSAGFILQPKGDIRIAPQKRYGRNRFSRAMLLENSIQDRRNHLLPRLLGLASFSFERDFSTPLRCAAVEMAI